MKVIEKRDDGTLRVSHVIPGESLTEQGHRPMCDINQIVARARETGIMPQVNEDAIYGDFSSGEDFLDMQMKLANAKTLFHEMPNKVRKHFKNDPSLFIDALGTEDGKSELKDLGVQVVGDAQEPPEGSVNAGEPVDPGIPSEAPPEAPE